MKTLGHLRRALAARNLPVRRRERAASKPSREALVGAGAHWLHRRRTPGGLLSVVTQKARRRRAALPLSARPASLPLRRVAVLEGPGRTECFGPPRPAHIDMKPATARY